MLTLEFEDCPPIQHVIKFFIPPVVYLDRVKRNGKNETVEKTSWIVANARARASTRGGTVRMYEPKKNLAEKKAIRQQFEVGMVAAGLSWQNLPWMSDFGIVLIAYGPIVGKCWEGKPYTKKPDLKNILGQVEDALNPEKPTEEIARFPGCWGDDAANTFCVMRKRYAQTGVGGQQFPGVMCNILLFSSPMDPPPRQRPLPGEKVRPVVECGVCGFEQPGRNVVCSYCKTRLKEARNG